jgi:hypothetical protein
MTTQTAPKFQEEYSASCPRSLNDAGINHVE